MYDLRNELMHYTNDLTDGADLKAEAVAVIERIVQYMEKDVLLNHSRPLALAYLALTEEVDSVLVVRCKDCKHSTLPSELTQRYGVPGTMTCHNRRSPCNRRNVGGDDFCSCGERRGGTDAEG